MRCSKVSSPLPSPASTSVAALRLQRLYAQLETGAIQLRDVPANLVDLVLQVGVAATTENVFSSYVYSLYAAKMKANTTGGDPDDPYAVLGFPRLIAALTETQDLDSLALLFERAADPRYFRPSDAGAIIRGAASNDYGLPIYNAYINSTQSHSQHIRATLASALPSPPR